jgi:uncharacterized glyoxalase superfamily protein PhnB
MFEFVYIHSARIYREEGVSVIQSFYPVLMTKDVSVLSVFYKTVFRFSPTFATDWYVSLRIPDAAGSFELAILDASHPTIPAGHRTESRGVILNVEVEDARAEYERIVGGGLAVEVLPLKDEEFGQRHFIVTDPAGNLVDVIENITPSDEFAASYADKDDGQG